MRGAALARAWRARSADARGLDAARSTAGASESANPQIRLGRGCAGSVIMGGNGWTVLAMLAALAEPARADRSIFLNGVKIDGVTNQTFRGCDVTIDAAGNVLISARGYSVERKEVKEVGAA